MLAFGGVDIVVNNAGLSISKSLFDTDARDWDLQHDVMARGSFLVTREFARVMRDQAMGGDIVYIVSKNAFFAGPNNVAYGAAKADQAHQVRLLAAELGEFGIRVNGVNPDGVVRGSGIFAKGWGADRARTYGVAGGQARRVLCPADAAQEGGPAGARRGRGVRARRRRPVADDRAPHPGRRRGGGRVPAVSAGPGPARTGGRCASPCSSPASTTCCFRRSGRRPSGCWSGWASRSSFPPTRPAAARCTSTPATATRRCRWSAGSCASSRATTGSSRPRRRAPR